LQVCVARPRSETAQVHGNDFERLIQTALFEVYERAGK